MQQVNVHQQKLVTIIIGVLGLIFLFLPWQKQSAQGFQATSYMGFTIWGGIICAVVIAGLIASCLLVGNRTMPFDKQGKIIAIVCFAIMLLMTIIIVATGGSSQAQTNTGYIVEVKKSAGIGAWLSLVLQVGGLAWVSGILNQLIAGTNTTSTTLTTSHVSPPSPPPPPPSNIPIPPPPPSS